jgi:PDZ domain
MAHARQKPRSRSLAVYAVLLELYAPAFLARHRAEMLQNFEDLENASSSKGALWLLMGEDLMRSLISPNVPKSLWGKTVLMFPALAVVFGVLLAFAPNKTGQFRAPFRNLTYGALLVPDRAVEAPTAPAMVDQAALAAFEGTYRSASSSSRDRQGEFGGLGIEIAMRDGLLKAVSPIRDAPAAKAGVMADDIITHLDDEATRGMPLNQALEKMRRPVNTRIRLRIERKGQDAPIELTIVRAPIRLAGADLQVAVKDGKLQIASAGALPLLDFEKGALVAVVPMSSNEFFANGGDRTRMAFLREGDGKATSLVVNPGPWQITGHRIN